jgi:VWFA-related protein
VRDKNGAVVRGLTRDDFSISEDDKPQTVTSFDFEELDKADAVFTEPDERVVLSPQAARQGPAVPVAAPLPAVKIDMRGRRLIVLFFDLSSMQPEEVKRAVDSAHDYVDKKLSPADLIAIASFSTSLQIVQDFTADREQLGEAIDAFGGVNGAGFEDGGNGDAEDTPDNGNAFTADDTEFNLFNTDRRLDALQTLADELAGIEQKKSVIYFSSGMSQQGTDNQVQLRRTVDRANRANVSIYAADMRGLQAMVPGGDATQGSRRGTSTFSGASTRNQFSSMAATQDTLTTMAEDTGGRMLEVKGIGKLEDALDEISDELHHQYSLGYYPENKNWDGKFRKVQISAGEKTYKVNTRKGYYANTPTPRVAASQ